MVSFRTPPGNGDEGNKPTRAGRLGRVFVALAYLGAFALGIIATLLFNWLVGPQAPVPGVAVRAAAGTNEAQCCRSFVSGLHESFANRLDYHLGDLRSRQVGGREFKFPPETTQDIPDALRAVKEHERFIKNDYDDLRKHVELGRQIYREQLCQRLFDYTRAINERLRTNVAMRLNPPDKSLEGLRRLHDYMDRELNAITIELRKELPPDFL